METTKSLFNTRTGITLWARRTYDPSGPAASSPSGPAASSPKRCPNSTPEPKKPYVWKKWCTFMSFLQINGFEYGALSGSWPYRRHVARDIYTMQLQIQNISSETQRLPLALLIDGQIRHCTSHKPGKVSTPSHLAMLILQLRSQINVSCCDEEHEESKQNANDTKSFVVVVHCKPTIDRKPQNWEYARFRVTTQKSSPKIGRNNSRSPCSTSKQKELFWHFLKTLIHELWTFWSQNDREAHHWAAFTRNGTSTFCRLPETSQN